MKRSYIFFLLLLGITLKIKSAQDDSTAQLISHLQGENDRLRYENDLLGSTIVNHHLRINTLKQTVSHLEKRINSWRPSIQQSGQKLDVLEKTIMEQSIIHKWKSFLLKKEQQKNTALEKKLSIYKRCSHFHDEMLDIQAQMNSTLVEINKNHEKEIKILKKIWFSETSI